MSETRSFVDSMKNTLFEQLLSSISQNIDQADFLKYQDDPVGFGEKVLEETFTGDVVRLMASVRDHTVTVAKSANATGKTHAAARIAVWFFKSFPESQVYTAAAPPESNLKKLLWGQIGGLIHKHPDLFKGDTAKDLHIQRSPQSFLTGVTIPSSGTAAQREARFSGKHAPHILFILDEGDAIPDEVYKGIESCMSGGHARLLVMFNPRQEAGEVVEEIRKIRFPVICRGIVPNVGAIAGYGDVNVSIQCAGVAVSPGDIVVVDGNGLVVVPMADADEILQKAQRLLQTEHLLQEKIKAGATIGELVKIDEVFKTTFAYQSKALESD